MCVCVCVGGGGPYVGGLSDRLPAATPCCFLTPHPTSCSRLSRDRPRPFLPPPSSCACSAKVNRGRGSWQPQHKVAPSRPALLAPRPPAHRKVDAVLKIVPRAGCLVARQPVGGLGALQQRTGAQAVCVCVLARSCQLAKWAAGRAGLGGGCRQGAPSWRVGGITQLPQLTLRKKIMPARGPRRLLCVVVVTMSAYSKGCRRYGRYKHGATHSWEDGAWGGSTLLGGRRGGVS
jgi:hypothetical protein